MYTIHPNKKEIKGENVECGKLYLIVSFMCKCFFCLNIACVIHLGAFHYLRNKANLEKSSAQTSSFAFGVRVSL